MCRRPLLRREIERRDDVRDRDDHATAGQHIGWVARIARGGVDAEGVLEKHLPPRGTESDRRRRSRGGAHPAFSHRERQSGVSVSVTIRSRSSG